MDFVEATLSEHCRRDAAQATMKSKLRGRRLLLESAATVALGEVDTRRAKRSRAATASAASTITRLASRPRRERRASMLTAVREVTYDQLLRRNQLWSDYAVACVGGVADVTEQARLVGQLDWHGARVRVVRSVCASHANASGLVLVETRRMLLLLRNARRVWVPKAGTLLEVALPPGLRCGQAVECDASARVGASCREKAASQN